MAISNTSSIDLQQLVITKCGSLWLIDYAENLTIKVLSYHTENINLL
jgi:hypothetical protein